MGDSVKITAPGSRGVNIVAKPDALALEEVITAQNAEVVSDKGDLALDQRPGMTRVNATPLAGGAVLMAEDVPASLLFDKTPTLYAGMYAGSTHNWRKTTDGTTWANADTPSKPVSDNTLVSGFFNRITKCATVGRKLFYVAPSTPIAIHSWDGVTDITEGTIPPAVSGSSIAVPGVYPVDPGIQVEGFGTGGVSNINTYKFVAVNGAITSAASAGISNPAITSPAGSGGCYVYFDDFHGATPPAGATSVDVYRTAGGATQGKIGTIPVVAGAYTTGNGSVVAPGVPYYFADNGLTGDGSTPPGSASGSSAGDALGVLDMVTDGTNLYLAVLDLAAADPTVSGRVLQFFPASGSWMQLGAAFPLAAGNGGPSALALYDGAFVFGTFIGITSGNTSYLKGLGTPLPAGGFPETHTTAVSQATCSLAVFKGDLYAGYVSLVAGTAAIVAKRTPVATWSTSLTGVATAQYNAYTSLGVFNGRLYAGWTSGGGATAANIKSTADGSSWTAEITLGVGEVPGQMVVFGGALYVACGKTGVGYNTVTRILKRDTAGTWTAVDDPADDFAGCLGVVYV